MKRQGNEWDGVAGYKKHKDKYKEKRRILLSLRGLVWSSLFRKGNWNIEYSDLKTSAI